MSEQGQLLPTLYQLDQTNGWSIGMRAITHALLARAPLPPGPLLEVGCGSGVLNAQLRARHPQRQVYGVDLHPLALGYARRVVDQPPKLARADLQDLPFPAATFGGLVALDAFDQQGVNLYAALAESWRLLLPQGVLLMRVSAHAWLQGDHDAAVQYRPTFFAV